jgi:uncharacterized protein DUF2617
MHSTSRRIAAVIHSTSTLRYRLLDGPARLEPLRVLQARSAMWRGWSVTFCVLGASHAVCLLKGGRQLFELLACAAPSGAARALAELAADRPGEVCVEAHGLICHARLTLFPLRKGDALRGDFAAADQLAVAYPTSGEGETPWTRVGWRAEGARLAIETVHTYPEEERGVRSESRFELRGAP